MTHFPWQQESTIRQSQLMLWSFQHWLGRPLFEVEGTAEAIARQLFDAPFVLLAHGTEADPIFNYGNRRALKLWELDWDTFTQMPSRQSAEAMVQTERDRLLAATSSQGFVEHFSGIRVSSTGRRFRIENGIIWNLVDAEGQYYGQAAIWFRQHFLN